MLDQAAHRVRSKGSDSLAGISVAIDHPFSAEWLAKPEKTLDGSVRDYATLIACIDFERRARNDSNVRPQIHRGQIELTSGRSGMLFKCRFDLQAAPVSHQKRSKRDTTNAINHGRKRRKINDRNRYLAAHNGLVAGSSPAEPTSQSAGSDSDLHRRRHREVFQPFLQSN
jgi:hypothetical protein